MSKTKEMKITRSGITVSLGIICIILIAGLSVVLFMAYSPTSGSLLTTYNNYKKTHSYNDSEYNSLLTTYNGYKNDHTYTNEQYQSLANQTSSLNNQVDDLTNTLNLSKSITWATNETVSQSPANDPLHYSTWTNATNYAGYLSVNISSTNNTIWVIVFYSLYGIHYDNSFIVWSSGTEYFPVLPSTVTVEVLNANEVSGATETVTITYYY